MTLTPPNTDPETKKDEVRKAVELTVPQPVDILNPKGQEANEEPQEGEDVQARENLGGNAADLLETLGLPQLQRSSSNLPDFLVAAYADGDTPGGLSPSEKGDGAQEKKNDKPPLVRLKELDDNFDETLKRFEKEIETEKVGVDMMSDVLRKAQIESLNIRIKTGTSLALVEDLEGKGDEARVKQVRKELEDLRKSEKTSERSEKQIFDHLPEGIRARTLKAAFQIASGKDEQINKGEIEFCQLVKENPQLATSKEFRQLVLLSYTEMAATRQLRGLGQWTPKVKADDIVGAKKDEKAKGDPIELLKKANEAFFKGGGIDEATPIFKDAIDAQKIQNKDGERKLLEMFISSIAQDTKIAQQAHAGKDIDELVQKRIEHKDLEQKAVEDAVSNKEVDASLRANFAFARIATGQVALYDEAVKDVLRSLRDNPSMSFDEGFQNGCKQAFKSHAENRKAIELAEEKGQKEKPKPTYNELDLKSIAKSDAAKNDTPVQSYWADDVTGPALLALGLGIAIAQFSRNRSKYHAADVMKQSLDAASNVKPVAGLNADTRVDHKGLNGESAKYEIKGSARDGRMVLYRGDAPGQDAPKPDFKEVKPGKNFSPEKMQLEGYTPVEVNGKKYYADKDGRTYKYERKMFSEPRLYEDNETRQIELVARKDVQSVLPDKKVEPGALDMTQERPERAMPKEWQREFDFLRDVKGALAGNDSHIARRLELLDRAVKGLNDTTYGDRQRYFAELQRQLKEVGINVQYTDSPNAEGAREAKLYVSVEGTQQRLVISGDKDKPVAIEYLDGEGKITKTETGTVKVADELTQFEKAISRQLKEEGVKEKLRAADPELDLDASNKEVRSSFLEGLPRSWRESREQVQKFVDAVSKQAGGGKLKDSIANALVELAKAPPAVQERALPQIVRELKQLGVEAKFDTFKAVGGEGKSKLTLSVTTTDGNSKLLFFGDGAKPGIEPNSKTLPGVIAYDDAAFDKSLASVSKKIAETAKGGGTTDSASQKPAETGDLFSQSTEAADAARARQRQQAENSRKVANLLTDKEFMKSVISSIDQKPFEKFDLTRSSDLEEYSKQLEQAFKDALTAKLKEKGLDMPQSLLKAEIDIRDTGGYTGRTGVRVFGSSNGSDVSLAFLKPPAGRLAKPGVIHPAAVDGDKFIEGKSTPRVTAGDVVTINVSVPNKLIAKNKPEALEQIYEKFAELAFLEGRDPGFDLTSIAFLQGQDKTTLADFSRERKGLPPVGEKRPKPSDTTSDAAKPQPKAETPKEKDAFLDRVQGDKKTDRPDGRDKDLGWETTITDKLNAYFEQHNSDPNDVSSIAKYIEALKLSKVRNDGGREPLKAHTNSVWGDLIKEARLKMPAIEAVIKDVRTANGVPLSIAQADAIVRMQDLAQISSPLEAYKILHAGELLKAGPDGWKNGYIAVELGLDPSKPGTRDQVSKLLTELQTGKYSAEKPKTESGLATMPDLLKHRLGLHQVCETLGVSVEDARQIVENARLIEPRLEADPSHSTLEGKWRSALDVAMVMHVEKTNPSSPVERAEAIRIADRLKILRATTSDIKFADAVRGAKLVTDVLNLAKNDKGFADAVSMGGETNVKLLSAYVEQQISAGGPNKDSWTKIKTVLDTNGGDARALADTVVNLANETKALINLPVDRLQNKGIDAEAYSRILRGVTTDHLRLIDREKLPEVLNKILEPAYKRHADGKTIEQHAIEESTWQIIRRTSLLFGANRDGEMPKLFKSLSTESLMAMMRASNFERVDTLTDLNASKLQRQLLVEAADRGANSGAMSQSQRRELIKTWADVVELGFADNAAVRASEFTKLIESCKPGDILSLPLEQALRIVGTVPFGALDKMHPADMQSLINDLKTNLRLREKTDLNKESQIEKSLQHYIEKQTAVKQVEAQTRDLLAQFNGNPQERALAAKILAERSKHLTPQGLDFQLRELGRQLEGMTTSYNEIRTGFQDAKRITVLVTGESTAGHALAVMLRNATGMSVDIQIIKPGMTIPPGPAVLLDKMPENEALARQIENRRGLSAAEGKILVPTELLDFHNGINMFDLARVPLNQEHKADVQSKLQQEVDRRKGVALPKDDLSLDRDVTTVMAALEETVGRHEQMMELKGLQQFESMRSNKQAIELANAFALASDSVTPEDAMRLAFRLAEKVKTEGKVDLSKAYIVVDLDREGSSHLITHFLRQANPKLDDSRFITMAQAEEMLRSGKLEDASALIYADDCLDGGKDSGKRVEALVELAGRTQNKPKVIAAMLASFPGEVKSLEGAQLITVQDVRDMKQVIPERLKDVPPTLLKNIGKSQWADTTVVPLVVTFWGVPNNCPEKFVKFANGTGSAQSNKLLVDAFAKPMKLLQDIVPVGKPVSNEKIIEAMTQVLDRHAEELSPVEANGLEQLRNMLSKAKPGDEISKRIRGALGLDREGGTKADTTDRPSVITGDKDPKPGDRKPGTVPHYEELSPGADKEIAEINKKISEVFKNIPRDKFKAMGEAEQKALSDAAVKEILPLMQKYCKRLGLPENLINADNISFDSLNGMKGFYRMQSDKIVLDIHTAFSTNTAFHELVHKARALDVRAAFEADPTGARLALMDKMLAGVGGPGRVLGDGQIAQRPQFSSPKVAAEYRAQVEHYMLKRLATAGFIDQSMVPPAKKPSMDLLGHFNYSEMDLYTAMSREVSNFSEEVDAITKMPLEGASLKYVQDKAADFKAWIENPKGGAVVRLAVHEVLTGPLKDGGADAQIKAIKERVALLTAQKKGDASTGIQVNDEFVQRVMEQYKKSSPELEKLIADQYAKAFTADGAARKEFDPTPRSLRDNPYLDKLVRHMTLDRVGRVGSGRPEYTFSSDELAARKGDIAERAKRMNREIKSGELDGPQKAEAEKAYKEFVDFLTMAADQQRLNNALATQDLAQARAIALELQPKLAGNVEFNANYMEFLLNNNLIKPEELAEPFKGFETVGGRAKAIAMDRARRNAIDPTDTFRRIVPGPGYTDYKVTEPFVVGKGTPSEMKVEGIRIDKDGTMSVEFFGTDGYFHRDPVEFHWSLEIDGSKPTEFDKAFAKAYPNPVGDGRTEKVAFFLDYLKQIEKIESKPKSSGTASEAASARPAGAEYVGRPNSRGVESLGGRLVDLTIPEKDLETAFPKASESVRKDLGLLKQLLDSKVTAPNKTPQDLQRLVSLVDRGLLEFFSPEDGKKIVDRMSEIAKELKTSAQGPDAAKSLAGAETKIAEFNKVFENIEKQSTGAGAVSKDVARDQAWIMHVFELEETDVPRQRKSIDMVRKAVGKQVPLTDVISTINIWSDLKFKEKYATIDEGIIKAYEIDATARDLQARTPGASAKDCRTAAEVGFRYTELSGKRMNPEFTLSFVRQAKSISKDLSPTDIADVLSMRREFVDLYKDLDKGQKQIDLKGAETEADVLSRIFKFVNDRALDTTDEAKFDSWAKIHAALDKAEKGSPKEKATAQLLTRVLEQHVVQTFLKSVPSLQLDDAGIGKTLEMMTESGKSVLGRLPESGPDRERFLDAWHDALVDIYNEKLPRKSDLRYNNAEFEFIRNLSFAEMGKYVDDIPSWIQKTVTQERLNGMDPESRAKLGFNLFSWYEQLKHKGDLSISDLAPIIKAIDPDTIRDLPKPDRDRLAEYGKQLLKAEAQRAQVPDGAAKIEAAVDRIVENVLGEHITEKTANELFAKLGTADRQLAFDHLGVRSQHLSIQGLNAQFESFAQFMRAGEGFVSNSPVRGRSAERIKIVCTGDSSQGAALAYLFRKATGIQVDIFNVTDPSQLPEGKFLLLDKLPDGKLGDALRERIGEGRAYHPDSIKDFHNGINLFDLARAELGGKHTEEVQAKVRSAVETARKEKGTVGSADTGAGTPLDATDLRTMRDMIRKSIQPSIEMMKQQGLLDMARTASYNVPDAFRKTMTRAAALEHGTDYVTYGQMMKDAQKLYTEQLTKGVEAKDVFFITNADSQGSARLTTQFIREANGLTDASFDKNFISLEKAIEMAKRGDLKGKRIVVVDDCIYTGSTAGKYLDRLAPILTEARGGSPELVIASLKAFESGIKETQKHIATLIESAKKAGAKETPDVKVMVGDPELIKDTSQTLLERILAKPLERTLADDVNLFYAKQFNRSDWGKSSVFSRTVYPHMVPNNNHMAMNMFYRLSLGIAGAHSESRFDDPRFDKYATYKIKGIDRFGYIGDQVLRGGKPDNEAAVEKLKEMGVTKVISLEKNLDAEKAAWFKSRGIDVIHMPLTPSQMKPEQISEVVKMMEKLVGEGEKVFVHCTHGRDRTGAVIATWRVDHDKWSRVKALEEMEDFGYSKKTKGLEYLPGLVPHKVAVEQIGGRNDVGFGMYQAEQKPAKDLKARYEKTKAESGVSLESKLRGVENWKEFRKNVFATMDGWTTDHGQAIPETLRYQKVAYEIYTALRDEAAQMIVAEAEGIDMDTARDLVDLDVRANPTREDPLCKAFNNYKEWTAEYSRQIEEIRPILDKRATELQAAINEFARSKGLPEVSIKWSQSLGHANNLYMLGEGTVLVKYSDLLERDGLPKLAERLYHEVAHFGQDIEVTRATMQTVAKDLTKDGAKLDPEAFRAEVRERLLNEAGIEITDEMFDLVDKHNKTQPEMTADELKRADALKKSLKDVKMYGDKLARSEADYIITDVVREHLDLSIDNRYTEKVLRELADPNGKALRQHLFGVSEVSELPKDIREQIETHQKAEKTKTGEAGKEWNGRKARQVLVDALGKRLEAINEDRKQTVEEYLKPLHEIESQTIEAEIAEHEAQMRSSATDVPKPSMTERIAKVPKEFHKGLTELMKAAAKGNKSAADLAERVLLLHENGKEIPDDIKLSLKEENAGEIVENAKVLDEKAAAEMKAQGVKDSEVLIASAKNAADRSGRPPGFTDRSDSLNLFNQQGKRPRDLLVRISYTTPDGITHQRLVGLHEIPPEALEDRLNKLSPTDLAKEVKAAEEKVSKLDEQIKAEKESAERKLKLQEERRAEGERLAGLKNLQEIKVGYDAHCKTGQGRAYCERTQAELRPGKGGKVMAAVGMTSVATGLLLLFEELVPETKPNTGGHRIVRPGGY